MGDNREFVDGEKDFFSDFRNKQSNKMVALKLAGLAAVAFFWGIGFAAFLDHII